MAERRNSLQPEPAAPRNNKRRRTMMDSVSDVARWLLPSWASEGNSETSPDSHQQTTSGRHSTAASGLSNGERNPKRARPNEITRREPMAPAAAEVSLAVETKNNQRRNRPLQNTKESKTRDVSISVDQTSIAAETSVTASPSLNFSLFSRPSRALSSTLNASLPLTGTQNASTSRSLSSSLHRPERSLNRSIFYDGKTTYGGAAAHRKLNLFSPSPYQMAAKRSKPAANVNVPDCSSAAKRLIEALERMNTPIQNAKKIPLGRPDNSSFSRNEAHRQGLLESIASLRQSSAPPPLSSCRSSVQPARIGSNVKPVLSSTPEYPIDIDEGDAASPSHASNVPVITPTPRPMNALLDHYGDSDRASAAGGKMKSAKTIQQHLSRKIPVEEEPPVAAPDLPSAPLPIKDLPSFSFAPKPPTIATIAVAASTPDCGKSSSIRSPLTSLADFSNKPFEKQQMSSSLVCSANDVSEAFTFAAPVDLDKPTKTLLCKEQFDFKDPLYLKRDTVSRPGVFAAAGQSMVSGGAFSLKTKTPEPARVAVPDVLSPGSVMDVIGTSDKRKDAPETSLSTDGPGASMFERGAETQKSETTKPPTSVAASTSSPVTNSWGDQFKKPASSWDCSTCCVNNQADSSSCVACGTAKPSTAPSSKTAEKPLGTTVANQWGDLFKKPAGQWSCGTCMVSNKAEASKCVACESPNPDSKAAPSAASTSSFPVSTVKSPLSAMIKMSPGWSCDTCLVRNDLDKSKCVACETPKPGSEAAKTTAAAAAGPVGFASGTPSAISSAFKFGVPESDENKNITSEPVTLVFGMKGTDDGSGSGGNPVPNGFKFGVSSPKSGEAERKSPFEQANNASKASSSTGFSFGTPVLAVPPVTSTLSATPAPVAPAASTASIDTNATPATTTSSGFSGFGAAWSASSTTKTEPATTGLFSFGASLTPSSSGNAPAAASATVSKGFTFGTASTSASDVPAAQPSTATFNFAAATAGSSATATTSATTSTFTFGGFSTTAKSPAASGGLFGSSTATPVFGASTTVTTAASTQPAASSGFSFTSPAPTGPASTPAVTATSTVPSTSNTMFTFGNPASSAATKAEPQNSGSAFVFGTAPRLSGFSFGAATPPTTTSASIAPTFTFGNVPASTAALPTASNGPSVFGSGSLLTSTPAFGAANSTTAPATTNAFQFKPNASPAAPAPSTPFAFNAGGTPRAATPSPGPLFTFGAPNAGMTNSPAPSTSANPVPGAAPFQFGAAAPAAVPAPGATPAPGELSFSFGQATTPASSFQFGAQPAGQTQAPFQFGGAAPSVGQGMNFPAPNAENPFNAVTQGRKMRRAVRRRGPR
ncbi:nuclear pore complex protein Nup153-like [Galendromus occidentalis]|uniref:Nuclear pore complex protein Nup153 n=1 Tax=Galendromus occidentalis TaxID=34638 RepID=A0AAJ7SH06_9ACAR|nr:nuclear pore complex protein Nup153-like [Galendromus occidentalis]